MNGIELSLLVEDLHKVPDCFNAEPRETINFEARLGSPTLAYITAYWGADAEIEKCLHKLPSKAFTRLTFDELCKVRYSSIFMMDSSVEDLFKKEPCHHVVQKITNSMWRWGMGRGVWNEVVDAYNAIRNFTLPVDGLEVSLDFTTGCNEKGYSEHSRTFLDGVFGLLLYYKGEHVMTLGFSIMAGKKLLIQQVQLKNRRGNRWLFKLPPNRMEFFIDMFRRNFKGYKLYVADGAELISSSLKNYRDALFSNYNDGYRKELHERIDHLEADLPRLAAFYADTGRFKLGSKIRVNSLTHRRLRLAA